MREIIGEVEVSFAGDRDVLADITALLDKWGSVVISKALLPDGDLVTVAGAHVWGKPSVAGPFVRSWARVGDTEERVTLDERTKNNLALVGLEAMLKGAR
jgi:hypothetical protein